MRGFYVHIPFCKTICSYCDFPKRLAKDENQINEYIKRLLEEIDTYKEYIDSSFQSIYIGGGTPNFLSDDNLELLLSKIESLKINALEYSIEINPELLTISQIELFLKYKITRISIGVQTFNEAHIKLLNRKHTKDIVFDAVNKLKKYNFDINIDLMNGFPTQTLENIKTDLNLFYKLDVNHLSYYNFILEQKTKIMFDYEKKRIGLIDEDLSADMIEYIIEDLNNHNYIQYEISNFAKKGHESIHNKIYWENNEYIGVGMGASGYLNSNRYDNFKHLKGYFSSFKETDVNLSINDKKNEFMMLGLRLINGVSNVEYNKRYNSDFMKDYDLFKYVNMGILKYEDDILSFTKKGLLIGNIVFEEFVG